MNCPKDYYGELKLSMDFERLYQGTLIFSFFWGGGPSGNYTISEAGKAERNISPSIHSNFCTTLAVFFPTM